MRLPGTIAERLGVIVRERARLLDTMGATELSDEGVAIECRLGGATACIRLSLPEQGIKALRGQKCADFALLLQRGDDVYEAHLFELTRTVGLKKWDTIREQLEWGTLHVLAIAGVLGVRIEGVLFYTVHHKEDLSRENAVNPAAMKIPVGSRDDVSARRWAEARRAWESGRIRAVEFSRDVEHRALRVDEDGRTVALCQVKGGATDDGARWVFAIAGG